VNGAPKYDELMRPADLDDSPVSGVGEGSRAGEAGSESCSCLRRARPRWVGRGESSLGESGRGGGDD
jgi:hypothetical protein